MKTNNINFILILLGLLFFSCGKKENVVVHQDQQATFSEPGQPSTHGLCPTIIHSKEDLITALNDPTSFPPEPTSPYTYQHWECTMSSFVFIFNGDFQSCGTIGVPLRSSSIETEGINHELASTKTALLLALSNAAGVSSNHSIKSDPYYPYGTIHQITADRSHNHPIWIINLCLPLIAQPIVKKNKK